MWNLISNAIRHTPSGGRVDVTAQTRDRTLEILVRDTGVGIAADELPHVFGDIGAASWREPPQRGSGWALR